MTKLFVVDGNVSGLNDVTENCTKFQILPLYACYTFPTRWYCSHLPCLHNSLTLLFRLLCEFFEPLVASGFNFFRQTDVAIVEPDDVPPTGGEQPTEVVLPGDHLGGEAHHQEE